MTELFSKFIMNFDIEKMSESEECLKNLSNNRYLPSESIVMQGKEIFNIFVKGTEGRDITE